MKQHSPLFLALVKNAKQRIREVPVQVLKNKLAQQEDLVLIDVREEQEWLTGHIPTALHISKGTIERDIEKKVPAVQQEIMVYCSGGFRSALVADCLQNMGYTQVFSLEKGIQGWIEEGEAIT